LPQGLEFIADVFHSDFGDTQMRGVWQPQGHTGQKREHTAERPFMLALRFAKSALCRRKS
jgi:hypothetical protein